MSSFNLTTPRMDFTTLIMELALQVADCLWLMESGGQLHIGKPRQLADEGVLSRFVESAGVTFDAASLTVRVTNRDDFV